LTAPARPVAPGRAPLGLMVKSSDSGHPANGGAPRHPRQGRGCLYKLLGVVQRLMYAKGLPAQLQAAVCSCQWRRIGDKVKVRRNKVTGRTHYRGLVSCNNVWACPVCSRRITDGRRDELQRAVGYWKDQGGECYLVTATFPHQRRDSLGELVQLMRKAADLFNTSRAARAAREAAGYVGAIRALEVTWGSWHGWHPHFHFLYFCKPGQLDTLRALETAWVDALIKAGLADRSQLNDMLHGAGGESAAWDVQNGDYAADYIAKFGHEPSLQSKIEAGATWGVAAEMVKGMAKTGRRLRGVTPFTLLAVVAGVCELRGMTKGRAAALFAEFAAAFKGQRQLYWSPKLRAVLQMGRLFTDAELAALEDTKPEYEDVGEISREDWALVLAHGHEDEVLAASEGGAAGLEAALAELRRRPPPPASSRITRELEDGTHALGLDSPKRGGL
jgi:replication protein